MPNTTAFPPTTTAGGIITFVQGLVSPIAIVLSAFLIAILWNIRLLHRNLMILVLNLAAQYYVGEIAGEYAIIKSIGVADPGMQFRLNLSIYIHRIIRNENDKYHALCMHLKSKYLKM